jgi:type I restriction enzyme S subunit
MWAINSPQFRHAVDGLQSGTTRKRISRKNLASIDLPVPPLGEQRRILAAIEELLSRVAAGEGVMGASLRRIESLRKRVLISSVPDAPTKGWTQATIGEAGSVQLGRQRSPKYHHGPHMRPYLRVANVFEDRIDTSDIMQMNFGPEEFERYRLRDGDILLNEGQTPDLVGRPAIYRGDPPEVGFTNSLLRFVPKSGIHPEYALLVFLRHLHAGRFKREARITTNIAHLSAGRLKAVEFPYPSEEEQVRIVREVDAHLSLISSLRATVESTRKRSAALRRAILERGFRGELVPQDPNDEPASVLLERIRAERRAAAMKPTRPKRVRA